MNRFAALLERLVLTPQRNVKLRLMTDYFRETPDPDRGYALASLTGELSIASVKPAMLRALITERLDPVLFGYSYDYVGDLAETIALAWPTRQEASVADAPKAPSLAEIVETLNLASRLDGPRLMERWLDQLDSTGRWGLIKLVTGGLRVGVSARLAKVALRNSAARTSAKSRTSGTASSRPTRRYLPGSKTTVPNRGRMRRHRSGR